MIQLSPSTFSLKYLNNNFLFADTKYIRFIFFTLLFIGLTSCHKDPANIQASNNLSDLNHKTVSTRKPNIILIIADDIGVEVPTYSGGESYSTPNLDFMAANGVQFKNCYCLPDGFPSRLELYTGKYNFRNYIGWGDFPPGEKTIGNMLQDAGYSTCFSGKWQQGGGDQTLKATGFDNYRVFLPFGEPGENQRVSRYKSPHLYENGAYLPDSVTRNKYSEDMFVNYIDKFIDSNKTKPFFIIYAPVLGGGPYVPTPDDPEFATWDPKEDHKKQDRKYWPDMVAYMDKKVGAVISKISSEGLADNTFIIYTSDNGTQSKLTSIYKGKLVYGGKTTTTKFGTNMSCVAYWPSMISPGITKTNLMDFADFLPTFADVARIPKPSNFGILDGVSFYDNMTGISGRDRDWVFSYWDDDPTDTVIVQKYVNNATYKLYDTIDGGQFFNIRKDIYEVNPIRPSMLTDDERKIKQQFQNILSRMHN